MEVLEPHAVVGVQDREVHRVGGEVCCKHTSKMQLSLCGCGRQGSIGANTARHLSRVEATCNDIGLSFGVFQRAWHWAAGRSSGKARTVLFSEGQACCLCCLLHRTGIPFAQNGMVTRPSVRTCLPLIPLSSFSSLPNQFLISQGQEAFKDVALYTLRVVAFSRRTCCLTDASLKYFRTWH